MLVPERVKKLSGVNDIRWDGGFPIEFVYKFDEFAWMTGVTTEVIAFQQAGAMKKFRSEDGVKGSTAFENRDADDDLARQRAADEAPEHCPGTDRTKDMRVGAGVDHSKNIFAAQDAKWAGSSFRDNICAGVEQGEPVEKIGTGLSGVIFPADKFQLHSVPDGGGQGGGKDRRSFTANDTDGVEAGLAGRKGGCDEVIGPGAAEGDDRIGGRLLCLLEVVF